MNRGEAASGASRPAAEDDAGTASPEQSDAASASPAPGETALDASLPPPATDCTNKAYVSNSFADSVSVIDTATNMVVATAPVGTAPVNPTFTLDRRQVYVSNSQGGTLSVIDVETDQVSDTIPAGGEFPSGLAFLPGGEKLVVTLLGSEVTVPGTVVVMTLATREVSAPIDVGAQPERIALSPDGQRAYISNLGDGTLSVIDLTTKTVTATIMVGELPFNPLMSPDGSRLYIGTLLANQVNAIDTSTNMIVDTIATDSPNGMAFSPDFESIYVTNVFANTVTEISLASQTVVRTEPAGDAPGFIDVADDGKRAYFVRPGGNTVDALDTATLQIVDTITVETGPSVVALCHRHRRE